MAETFFIDENVIRIFAAFVFVLNIWDQLSEHTPSNFLLTYVRFLFSVCALLLLFAPTSTLAYQTLVIALALRLLEKFAVLNWWRVADRRRSIGERSIVDWRRWRRDDVRIMHHGRADKK